MTDNRSEIIKDVITIPANNTCHAGKSKARKKIRVAAYCRVSTDEERQLDSFENQVEHYTEVITSGRNYELAGIYSDEGLSGCSTRSRKGFCAMIRDCEAGKIDLIITKSISRFARNTQDSLNYTRKLKDMGIGICFEKEGINTLESSGELLLTLFSCFAQEESRSISENTSWGIRSRFRQGIPHINTRVLLGYDKDEKGSLEINEEEAVTVRRIFSMFLEGWSLGGIARQLNKEGVRGVHGEAKWCSITIDRMLSNEKYKGSILMQKTFTVNYLTRKHVRNDGELEQYYIEKNHPAIIEPEEWEAVQQEKARRREFREKHGLRGLYGSGTGESPFYARLFCADCGSKLQRIYRKGVSRPYWLCNGCGCRIADDVLREKFCDAFNQIVERRTELIPVWSGKIRSGTALEKLRARQMMEITEPGVIPYEIPELTRAILQEIRIDREGQLRFTFLSGETVHQRD